MAWIKQVPVEEATGKLKEEFAAAMERAEGRVWNILRVMSVNPDVLSASMAMYGALMHGESPLSRQQREMLATVVSAKIGCVY